ncbi:MAG: DUF357 domain-containing protein [Candidatus Aenigmarchaeota archaeon]|nr:DUF357 domain-containing protein [Candidatus Aenigmarchaeota archaeon]
MEIEILARKEMDKVELILKKLKLIDSKGKDILSLINSYFEDAKYFYSKKQFIQAFEAAIMCWTYADAGLHLEVFEIPEELRKLFTLEK